ncbi:DUF3307 domain-containing protein [Salinicola rhizosphaerae]|uniref:DUF3307 domain-containing protein n=1 Tax=Salinicola rhizosphaerae TaxID=1443141 RepID=A0ABQ3DPJ8_9GAMM|nr:DUF3307 domain-containing protein [Salinicola rhizosphaerae]GHB08479.1 hypothetical protein GCM10009038_02450 [Salinicola rhizosphaerae]
MSDEALSLLLSLLLAHVIGDFLLQSNSWAAQKRERHFRAPSLYAHVAIHMALNLAALRFFDVDWMPALLTMAAIGISHWLIDVAKSYTTARPIRYFVLDQGLHLLIVVWLWTELQAPLPQVDIDWSLLWQPDTLLLLLAYLVAMKPASVLIALIMRRWSQGVDTRGTLADAGARIGMLERFLILTFVLSHQMAAIGFLLTAKSVLRFGDLYEDRDRKLTEYVLLGTMLSFSLTLTLGLATRYLLTRL